MGAGCGLQPVAWSAPWPYPGTGHRLEPQAGVGAEPWVEGAGAGAGHAGHTGQAPLLSFPPARVHNREHWTPT